MNKMGDMALEYIAQQINISESYSGGYSAATRWFCLREDLRQEYLAEARDKVATWWADEQRSKAARELL